MRKADKAQYIKDIVENWRKHSSAVVYMNDMLSGYLGRINKYHDKSFSYDLSMNFHFLSLEEAKQFAAEFAWLTWQFRDKFAKRQNKLDRLNNFYAAKKVRNHAR